MSALARPGVLAALLVASAVVLHPAALASRWRPGRPALLAALLLLAALGLVARAASAVDRRVAGVLAAAGAAVLLAALGWDGLRGHHGTLTLVPGQVRPHFDEEGPDGRALGLRPLGFAVGAERVSEAGSVTLALAGRDAPVELTPARAVGQGGYRLARPRVSRTGGASRLRVAASDGARTTVADVAPGAPGRAGDVTIALEEYFPDFALDERQQPYSRSAEPRNPAALLAVGRDGQSYRAFVLKSMPGVHRVEPLGLVFSLLDIEPERQVEIAVHREPAALGVLLGAVLLAAGVALGLRRVPASPLDGDADVAGLGLALALALLVTGRGAVLSWSFGLPGGRVPLPGVGVAFGAALVLVLGGALFLGAARLAGDEPGVRRASRGALWLAVALAAAGLMLAAVRLASVPGGAADASLTPLLVVALAVVVLAGSLVASRVPAPPLVSGVAPLVLPLGAIAAIALAVAAGVTGFLQDGTYATPAATAAASAALAGLAALEPTGARGLRAFLFLLALFAIALA